MQTVVQAKKLLKQLVKGTLVLKKEHWQAVAASYQFEQDTMEGCDHGGDDFSALDKRMHRNDGKRKAASSTAS